MSILLSFHKYQHYFLDDLEEIVLAEKRLDI